jgi:hypothetical protein
LYLSDAPLTGVETQVVVDNLEKIMCETEEKPAAFAANHVPYPEAPEDLSITRVLKVCHHKPGYNESCGRF